MLWDRERQIKVYSGIALAVLSLSFLAFSAFMSFETNWTMKVVSIIGMIILVASAIQVFTLKWYKEKKEHKKWGMTGVMIAMTSLLLGMVLLFSLYTFIFAVNTLPLMTTLKYSGAFMGLIMFIVAIITMFL